MRVRDLVLAVSILLVHTAPVAAQAWDAPAFFSPRPGDEIGAYVLDPPSGDLGAMVLWRQGGGIDLGVRLGIASGDDETRVFFGGEFFGSLFTAGGQFPLDVAWLVGAGATLGDISLVRIPAGVSIGREVELADVVILPYAFPRVGLDFHTSGDNTDTEFSVTVDLGFDLRISGGWLLRFAVALGDHDALGAGVAYELGRRVTAR